MTSLLSLDPGIRGVGVAFFQDKLLVLASYVRNPSKHGNGPAECLTMAQAVVAWVNKLGVVDDLVVEWPRIYTVGKQSDGEGNWRDPNDLLPLVGVDCAVAALLPNLKEITRLYPDNWKAQNKKSVTSSRGLARLSEDEKLRVEDAGELTHNLLDALVIGLYKLGRYERVRVFPGATRA